MARRRNPRPNQPPDQTSRPDTSRTATKPIPPAHNPTEHTTEQGTEQSPPATTGDDEQTTSAPVPTPADTGVQEAMQDTAGDMSALTDSNNDDQSHGPIWSASEAAKQCGVGRTTIVRKLQAGSIPGATKDEEGHWQIPLSGLLAAGLNPVRPAPAEIDDAGQDAEVTATVELAELRGQLEVERAKREAAEQLAAERSARIEDLRHALKMIEAPIPTAAPSPVVNQPDHPVQEPQPEPQPEGVAGKLKRWWRGK